MSLRGASRLGKAVAALAVVALCGCGDPELWERYRAERAFWQAQREVNRLFVNPRVARPSDFQRAERAFQAIESEFPPERWAREGGSRTAGDIAEVSGRAALSLARLAELQGRNGEAISAYARVATAWRILPELTLEAEVLHALALEKSGDREGALAGWERVARGYDPVDAPHAAVRRAVVEAPLRIAESMEARGESARRDSLLDAERRRLSEGAARLHGSAAAGELLDAVGERCELGGDLDAAWSAWRAALAEPAADSTRARRVLILGERWLADGRPDSALRWAAWAAEDFGRIARSRALDLTARAEMRAGRADSALAVWDVILVEFQRDPDATASARFARAEAFEATDRWTQARTELSALCASQPTHPRALDAWVRVVTHYRREGEIELARIEAEHAFGTFTLLLTSQHDPGVRRRVGEARVGVLLALGRTRDAIDALRGVWSGEGVSPAGAILGARAARSAGSELHDEALARSLWQILAERAPDPEVRREAAAALERRPS